MMISSTYIRINIVDDAKNLEKEFAMLCLAFGTNILVPAQVVSCFLKFTHVCWITSEKTRWFLHVFLFFNR